MAGAGHALALHWVLMAESPSVGRRGGIPDRDGILPDVENTPDGAVDEEEYGNGLETISGLFFYCSWYVQSSYIS